MTQCKPTGVHTTWMPELVLNLVKLITNWTKLGNVLKLILISPSFVLFVANLTKFGTKPDNTGRRPKSQGFRKHRTAIRGGIRSRGDNLSREITDFQTILELTGITRLMLKTKYSAHFTYQTCNKRPISIIIVSFY